MSIEIVANSKALDDEIKSGLKPEEALVKMQNKKYICGACGRPVAYGAHCSVVPNGDLSKDKTHAEFAASHGYLYQEIVVK